ncbi:MAG: hypothetical protein N3A02_04185, partial [Rectinema sp.]|nr:hypothetical protein [Rectinema sp.]
YYAIQVVTRHENDWIERISRNLRTIVFHKIMKKMYIRRAGKTKLEDMPLFPGYIFFEYPDDTIPPELLHLMRRTKYFMRFLPCNENPRPLDYHDQEIIRHFINFGSLIPPSLVTFDENQRIRVVQGPLQGIEGLIVKVDRRKRRAKVRLTLADSVVLLDLAFEVMEGNDNRIVTSDKAPHAYADKRIRSA